MKQIFISQVGGPEVLTIKEVAKVAPQAGQVTIAVKAIGINFADILARRGLYPDAPPLPCVVGYEVSGVIESVGAGVDPAQVGKAVMAMTRFGGYSEYVTISEHQVFDKPDSLSFEQAAAIPVNYLTAQQLIVMGGLRAGESILIHNAGGGVGLAALDIAKKIGAKTYGTASSSKHPFLLERGLDVAIDYRQKDWAVELNRLTAGQGVELILDPLGGKHWKKSYKALRSSGRLGMFGISTASEGGWPGRLSLLGALLGMPFFHPIRLLNDNKGAFGVNMGHMWHEPEKMKTWIMELMQGLKEGWIRPHVDKAFPLAEVGAAQRYIEERKNTGKVVLVV